MKKNIEYVVVFYRIPIKTRNSQINHSIHYERLYHNLNPLSSPAQMYCQTVVEFESYKKISLYNAAVKYITFSVNISQNALMSKFMMIIKSESSFRTMLISFLNL